MNSAKIIGLSAREARLKRMVRKHLRDLGFSRAPNGTLMPPSLDKEAYRRFHRAQKADKLEANRRWLDRSEGGLIKWFADGRDINPALIRPEIELVSRDTWQSDLFRLAALYWQIPVSDGYGRRMRFLVWDRAHGKLMGIFALGDAVFNQAARDDYIGWDHHRRGQSLVNLMDAYVLGALPPYSQLLGGKLVASLIKTREVVDAFTKRYNDSTGLISGQKKKARLVAVTTTSALGRSSVYNRLQLAGKKIFEPIGFTSGWGHFHFSGRIFDELRAYLDYLQDDYADGFNFGSGPNWKIRVIRRALERLGMDTSLARHGFTREVFISKIARNAEAYLRGDNVRALYGDLSTVAEVARAARERWVEPRAIRDPRYLSWRASDLLASIHMRPIAGQSTLVSTHEMGD